MQCENNSDSVYFTILDNTFFHRRRYKDQVLYVEYVLSVLYYTMIIIKTYKSVNTTGV